MIHCRNRQTTTTTTTTTKQRPVVNRVPVTLAAQKARGCWSPVVLWYPEVEVVPLFLLPFCHTRPFRAYGWLNVQLRNVTQIYWLARPASRPTLSFYRFLLPSTVPWTGRWREDGLVSLSIPPFGSLWIPTPVTWRKYLSRVFAEAPARCPTPSG